MPRCRRPARPPCTSARCGGVVAAFTAFVGRQLVADGMTEQQDMRLVDSRMLPAAPHLTCTPRAPRPHTCPPHLQLAFLMAATSACEVHEAAAAPEAAQQPPAEGGGRPASSAALNLARSYLAQSRAAGAVLAAAQAMEGQQAGADPKSDVFAALLVGAPARKPGILGRGCRSAFGGDVAQPSLLAAAASRCAAPGRNTALCSPRLPAGLPPGLPVPGHGRPAAGARALPGAARLWC